MILSHCSCQIILLGDADSIIEHICEKLGWALPPAKAGQYLSGPLPVLMKRRSQECVSPAPKRVADRYVDHQGVLVYCSQCVTPSHIWLFEGAEGGKWLSDFEAAQAQVALPFGPTTNAPLPSPSTPMTSVDAQRDTKRARVL